MRVNMKPKNIKYDDLLIDFYASAYAPAAEPAALGLKRKHGAPLYRNLEVSLENCYHGGTFDVTLTRRVRIVAFYIFTFFFGRL